MPAGRARRPEDHPHFLSPGERGWSPQAGEGDAVRMKFYWRLDWTFRFPAQSGDSEWSLPRRTTVSDQQAGAPSGTWRFGATGTPLVPPPPGAAQAARVLGEAAASALEAVRPRDDPVSCLCLRGVSSD